ncbi:MAG: fused MFS/spermidine synthase [Propionibacteriaceae bacterium]|nr:fused MFS/spermidine synthase [Propionibacteriaceae bacterium]
MKGRVVPDPEQPGAWYVRINGTDHSWIDPNDPLRLEFDYMQRIADVIDTHAPPGERLRVLHIGGAGMTLPRYVAARRPTSAQVVLEPDASLTEEVRRLVPLPRNSGIKVRAVDGRAGVAAVRDGWAADAVVVDAFVDASVPADLTTVEFFADVRRILAPAGVLLLNVTDKSPFVYTRRVLAGLTEIFPEALLSAEPPTLKGRRFGNILLAGSAVTLPIAALARKAAGSVFPYRVLHGVHLARFGSGGAPFTDADSGRSPEPPGGPAFFR